MDKLTQWNMTDVLGGVRKSTYSYQRASHESDGGESLLSEEKPSETAREDGPLPLTGQERARLSWIKYVFFVLGLAVYSFMVFKLGRRQCSDSECGSQVSLWCEYSRVLMYGTSLTVQRL